MINTVRYCTLPVVVTSFPSRFAGGGYVFTSSIVGVGGVRAAAGGLGGGDGFTTPGAFGGGLGGGDGNGGDGGGDGGGGGGEGGGGGGDGGGEGCVVTRGGGKGGAGDLGGGKGEGGGGEGTVPASEAVEVHAPS